MDTSTERTLFLFVIIIAVTSLGDTRSVSMCNKDGICHETPWIPSPRTVYSTYSQRQMQQWNKAQNALAHRISDVKPDKLDLLLLGDSITESWEGKALGQPHQRFSGPPASLEDCLLGRQWPNVQIHGLSGDQTQHLLWRIESGGELPTFTRDLSISAIILIGTNNIHTGHLPNNTAKGIHAVAETVLEKLPKGRVLVSQVLPRSDRTHIERICPPRCNRKGEPYASYLPAVEIINHILENVHMKQLKEKYGNRVGLAKCNQILLEENKTHVIMPDGLHPNGRGMHILGNCFAKQLELLKFPNG
eukprot:m.11756 g.11756  ORF g.11756 m.11756 type:complete len:304 (-) comp4514_c0_seq1:68-979(-)